MAKAKAYDIAARTRQVCADPSNALIPRVPNAGQLIDGHLVMHNGLRVQPMDLCYMSVLRANRGCHEPQLEWVFQQVLGEIPDGATMMELGASWAFYSMWFFAHVRDASCVLVEPDPARLALGRRNFELNGCRGTFIQDYVGPGQWELDRFMRETDRRFVNLLLADIQGAEVDMLEGGDQTLSNGRVGYVFLGTHGQDVHYRCKEFLERRDYVIVAHADFDRGTYCFDGVLVARHRSLAGLTPLTLPLREAHAPYSPGDARDDLSYLRDPDWLGRLRWRYHAWKYRLRSLASRGRRGAPP